MTLKSGQGHQTWYELPDNEQDCNHAMFERPPLKLNSACQKANVKVFVKSENMSIISLEYVQKVKKIVVYSLSTLLT